MDFLLLALALVIVVPVLINVALVTSINKMSRPDTCIEPAAADAFPAEFNLARIHHDWATREGFQIAGGYVYRANAPIFIAAWQYRNEPTWFCIYATANRTHFDLVTQLSENTGLTTGSTSDGALLPRQPGNYVETYPGSSPTELWQRHQEGLAFLKQALRLPPYRETRPLDLLMMESIRRQLSYIKTLPAWWLRGPYWYFVRKNLFNNKPVETLFRQGRFPA